MNRRPQIMVIDDDQRMLRLLEITFEQEGYDAILAADGNSALALLENCTPDLIILDIIMPGPDGLQVLEVIRQRSNVPVIMLTARHEVTIARDALLLGADDYVRKPFHTMELLAHIKAKLRRAGS